MESYTAQPITLRATDLFEIVQKGERAHVIAKSPRIKATTSAAIFVVAEIKAADQHFAKAIVPAMEKAGYVAFVITEVDGNPAQLGLTAEQYAAGAPERARFAAWNADVIAWKAGIEAQAADFDARHNEGAEGYNPYRG